MTIQLESAADGEAIPADHTGDGPNVSLQRIAVYFHPNCLGHDTGPQHVECIDRLPAIFTALAASSIIRKMDFIEAPLAAEEDLLLAHEAHYVKGIYPRVPSFGYAYLDADTVISPGSLRAALRAAGAGIAAVKAVFAGQYANAFCAVRPPGHHATRNHAMGFCLFNNIAITALYALKYYPLSSIAIVDFDVHHGNGTQDIVESQPRILYISTHQSPLYPGTGTDKGRSGHIINLPLPSATDGATYRKTFSELVIPALDAFAPNLLLVSAGFDAHRDDPLAGLMLVEGDYHWIGEQLATVAKKHCKGKLISFLEGGYHLGALGTSVVAYLEGCCDGFS